jgi:hypothetical protein
MTMPATYRVVAVRADGSRLVISSNVALEAAESVVDRLRHAAGFREIKILSDATGADLPPKQWQSPKGE